MRPTGPASRGPDPGKAASWLISRIASAAQRRNRVIARWRDLDDDKLRSGVVVGSGVYLGREFLIDVVEPVTNKTHTIPAIRILEFVDEPHPHPNAVPAAT